MFFFPLNLHMKGKNNLPEIIFTLSLRKNSPDYFFLQTFHRRETLFWQNLIFPTNKIKKTKKKKSILSNISNKYLCTCRLRKAKHTNFNSITFFTTLFISLSAILYSTFYFTALCERHCSSILFLFFIIFWFSLIWLLVK